MSDSEASWSPESVRLTAFWASGQSLSGLGLWKRLTGRDPDVALKKGANIQESGPVLQEGDVLFLSLNPVSITVQLKPPDEPRAAETPAVLSTPYDLAITHLRTHLATLSQDAGLVRIAFGAVLAKPVQDRRSGYVALQPYLSGLTVDPDTMSDLLYRVNRPARSAVLPDMRINRLSTWSVNQTVQVVLSLSDGTNPVRTPGAFACQLQLDVNTDATRQQPLPQESVLTIWDELVSHGRRIASEGDRP